MPKIKINDIIVYMDQLYDVIIIGGGASGMMASIFCARNGYKTLVIEHNEKLGKKLFITGKGRCNLTNDSSIENHLNNIVTNNKFMYTALNKFSAQDTIEFFESLGLELKTERGNRVFPMSDKSSDVIKILNKAMDDYGVKTTLNTEVEKISKENNSFNIWCRSNIKYTTRRVIVATGGISYKATGSTGIGYEIAKSFGHHIIEPKSALCPILIDEDISSLNGLSLKNIELSIEINGKKISQFGEMMFTFNSLTGPTALTLSSLINKHDYKGKKISIDFKPALSFEQLDDKFIREFTDYSKKDLKTYIKSLLPNKICDYFMSRLGIINKKLSDMTKTERHTLINSLKKFDFSVKTLDNVNVGIITSGGVDIKEIDSKTCESKLVSNLYFVGEILDVDALTGGYNLQIAWSTAYLAGNNLKGKL